MLKLLRKLMKDEKGFTLIELMVVVVIIGILAAIAVPAFSDASDKAKKSKAKADLRTLESGLALYYAQNNSYPVGNITNLKTALESGYVKKVPTDPWGTDYYYSYASSDTTYTLKSYGPDKTNGTSDDINSSDL